LKTDPYDFCQKNKNEIIKQINNINLSSIFLNLYNTLENNILINIISNMITKNKGLITNELKIRELNITSEKIGE
jgi:hypothetical protein